jgi:hypothetical protein
MTNSDYNPFFRPERLSNDRRQIRYTTIGLVIAAVLAVALILVALQHS